MPSQALGDDSQELNGDFRIHLGHAPLSLELFYNFITASVAVVLDSFSLVFIAYTDPNGVFWIVGVCSISFGCQFRSIECKEVLVIQFDVSTSGRRNANDGFDIRPISDGPVDKLEWRQGTYFIYAMTSSSVS